VPEPRPAYSHPTGRYEGLGASCVEKPTRPAKQRQRAAEPEPELDPEEKRRLEQELAHPHRRLRS
jgi:hypothetical protein